MRKAARYSLPELAAIAYQRAKRLTLLHKSYFFDTRTQDRVGLIVKSHLKIGDLDISGINKETANYLIDMYLDHRFNLLGSGWVKNSYFTPGMGVEGNQYHAQVNFKIEKNADWLKHLLRKSYVKSSRQILNLITDDYENIDWQKDYKSGYRWSQKVPYLRQPIGHLPGVDVKIPWELSRMQHLPQLAILSALLPERTINNVVEFRNQILDFIATNPPQMGINWTCAMDVGIRAANMLLAYDLFKQVDGKGLLDHSFCQTFANSIYEHGKHIINNLEYSATLTTNHYLSNIAGLLFISSYLESTSETDFWYSFSYQQLMSEFKKQFYDDGGNFEASTSYHCLSTGLITYSTALLLGIPDEKKALLFRTHPHLTYPRLRPVNAPDPHATNLFSNWYIERLFKSGKLIAQITKRNGNIAQIGDNDSGHLFKLSPNGNFLTNSQAEETYLNLKGYCNYIDQSTQKSFFWDENSLNQQPILSGLGALFDSQIFQPAITAFPLEHSVIRSLSGNRNLSVPAYSEIAFFKSKEDNSELEFEKEILIRTRNESIDLLKSINAHYYKDSGLLILQSEKLFVVLSAGGNGQNGIGGHAHNDKLSIELSLAGDDLVVDPGTYLYTASPEWRNRFRSVAAHPTLNAGFEQNTWTDNATGLFALSKESECQVLEFQRNVISAKLIYRDVIQARKVEISGNQITISDRSNKPFDNNLHAFQWFSNGYGKIRVFKPNLGLIEIIKT